MYVCVFVYVYLPFSVSGDTEWNIFYRMIFHLVKYGGYKSGDTEPDAEAQ